MTEVQILEPISSRVGQWHMRPRNNHSIQFTGKNANTVLKWARTFATEAEVHKANMLINMDPVEVVRVVQMTLGVNVTVRPGDYLLLSDTGVFYSMPETMWNLTYNKG